jgi:hypothetical protein
MTLFVLYEVLLTELADCFLVVAASAFTYCFCRNYCRLIVCENTMSFWLSWTTFESCLEPRLFCKIFSAASLTDLLPAVVMFWTMRSVWLTLEDDGVCDCSCFRN